MVTDDFAPRFQLFSTNQSLSPSSDWSPDLSSVASEAASHRQKLERLRRAFLNPNGAHSGDESLSSVQHSTSLVLHFQQAEVVRLSVLESDNSSQKSSYTCSLQSNSGTRSTPKTHPALNEQYLSATELDHQTSLSTYEPLNIDRSTPSDDAPQLFALRCNSLESVNTVDQALSPVYQRRASVPHSGEFSTPLICATPASYDQLTYPCMRISTEPHVTYTTLTLPDNHSPVSELLEYANNHKWPNAVELFAQDMSITHTPSHSPPPSLSSQPNRFEANHMQAHNTRVVTAANWSNHCSPVTTSSFDVNRSSATLVSNSISPRCTQTAVAIDECSARFVVSSFGTMTHRQEQFVRTTNSPRTHGGKWRQPVELDQSDRSQLSESSPSHNLRRSFGEPLPNLDTERAPPPQSAAVGRVLQPRQQQQRGMDENLSKMDETLRDFNSHLSQIDSTLGRLKGFGSLSKYLDELCTVQTVPGVDGTRQHTRTCAADGERTSIDFTSSSEDVGKSFECYPQPELGMANSSSTLGTSLTTLSSSVWSSLSPSGLPNGGSSVTSSSTVGAGKNFQVSPSNRLFQGGSTSYSPATCDFENHSQFLTGSGVASRRLVDLSKKKQEPIQGRSSPCAGRNSPLGMKTTNLPIVDDVSSPAETETESDTYSSPSCSNGAMKPATQFPSTTQLHHSYRRRSEATYHRPPRSKVTQPSESPTRLKLHMSSPELHVSPPLGDKLHQTTTFPPSSTIGSGTVQSVQSLAYASRRPRHRQFVFSPSSNSSSSGFSGGHVSEAEWDQSINSLMDHLSHLLHTGQETEARRVIGTLLETTESRSRLEALIASLGGESGTLASTSHRSGTPTSMQSLSRTRHQSPRASLLRIAESLMALCNKRGMIPTPNSSRSSLHSLARTYESDFGVSNPSLIGSASTWRRQFDPYHLSQNGSSGSLMSGPSLTFIQWPSDVRVEERLPSMRPTPRPIPPSHSKSSIIPTVEVLQEVDVRAIKCTAANFVSFTELVHALTAEMSDDVHMLRVLFAWTVFNDVRFKEFDPAAPPDSLVGMLRRIRGGQLTRNDLLHKLCRFAGLHCQLITGYSKGIGYRPGMPIKNNRLFASSWLVVYVAGGWRFVNADLAMKHAEDCSVGDDPSDADQTQWNKLCDEFFFLTDPEQHIFISFPDHKIWQLLNKPINTERFAHLPLLKSAFFNANLSLKKNYGDCLITTNGQVTIKLHMPQFVGISCSLENCADHSVLRGLCLVEVLDESDVVRIQVAPCQPGKYYLHVYVSPDWRQEALDRELACSFQVHCSEHNYSRLIVMGRLPEVGFLGPTPVARTLGVSMYASGRSARPFIVHTSAEPMRIPFAIAPGLKLCHQLKSFDRPGHQMVDCDSYALLQMRPSKPSRGQPGPNAFYLVRMPIEGFYYLTIYATSNADLEADHLECVYRILIDVRRAPPPSSVPAFPRQTFWWVHCRLHEPMCQRLHINRSYIFRIDAPLCDSVAVVINETDWKFLTNQNRDHGTWFGKIHVGEYLGCLSVYGRFWKTVGEFHPPLTASDSEESEEAYVKLLDYVLVE